MEKNKSLQQLIDDINTSETPVVLDYARVENKTNWKKVALYGGIVGTGVVSSFILYKLYDLYSTLRGLNSFF
ncbi:hypothetical protein HYV88_02105 [Candidatus Woesearchaeota archaeon]|nr:hypothetical protein [Candidatus Woesearchaeota archaeon]